MILVNVNYCYIRVEGFFVFIVRGMFIDNMLIVGGLFLFFDVY